MTLQTAPSLDPVDAANVLGDFPILNRRFHGHRLVYLDNAATSQKPVQVLDALRGYYENSNANVHRGVYALAEEATELYEGSRARVARFISAASPEEVIFTRNATEAINMVASGWGRLNVRSGDAIVISALEHHSNFVPWLELTKAADARLIVADLDVDGLLDLNQLVKTLQSGNVRLVAVAGVSNVMGVIHPIQEISTLAHEYGALVLVDAAQMAPHMPLDVCQSGADFVAFTGHKMLGPMGIGVLWAREELLQGMDPVLFGGEMIRRVTEIGATWNELPWKFEAGTPNVEGAVGLSAAIEYLEAIGLDSVRDHEIRLTDYLLERLGTMGDVSILGPKSADRRGGVVAFNVGDIHPHDLATILDSRCGVAVRAGHHCAQPLHERLGLAASTRASVYIYNTTHDVDALCDGIDAARMVMA